MRHPDPVIQIPPASLLIDISRAARESGVPGERIAPSAAPVAGVAEALKAATKDSDADVRGAAEVALAAIEKARR